MTESLEKSALDLMKTLSNLKAGFDNSWRRDHRKKLEGLREENSVLKVRLKRLLDAISDPDMRNSARRNLLDKFGSDMDTWKVISIPKNYYDEAITDLQLQNKELAEFLKQHLDKLGSFPSVDQVLSRLGPAGDIQRAREIISFLDRRNLDEKLDKFDNESRKVLNGLDRDLDTLKQHLHKTEVDKDRLSQELAVLHAERTEGERTISSLKKLSQSWKQRSEDLSKQLIQLHSTLSSIDDVPLPFLPTLVVTNASSLSSMRSLHGMKTNLLRLMKENKNLSDELKRMTKQKRLFEVNLRSTQLDMDRCDKGGVSSFRQYNNTSNLETTSSDRLLSGESFESQEEKSLLNELLSLSQSDSSSLLVNRLFQGYCNQDAGNSNNTSQTSSLTSRVLFLLTREFFANWNLTQSMYSLIQDLQEMNRIRDLDSAVTFIIEAICRILESDRASYWLVDPVKNIAWTKKAKGGTAAASNTGSGASGNSSNSPMMETLVIPLNSGLVGAAYSTRRVINVADAYTDPRFNRQVDARTGYRTKAVLCIPIQRACEDNESQTEVVGVVQAINKVSASTTEFTEKDANVLHVLGYSMLNVLESCQSYDENLKSTRRRDILLDSADDILRRGMSSKRDLFALIKEKMSELFKAAETTVYLVYKDFVGKVAVDREGSISTVDSQLRVGLVGKAIDERRPVHAVLSSSGTCSNSLYDSSIDIDIDKIDPLSMGVVHSTNTSSSSSVVVSSGVSSTIHTWPLVFSRDNDKKNPSENIDGKKIVSCGGNFTTAVIQWVSFGKGPVRFGDDGNFNENMTSHVDVLRMFLDKMILNFIDRFWPCNLRLYWTRSKKQKLRVRTIVSFPPSLLDEQSALEVEIDPTREKDQLETHAVVQIQRWVRDGYSVSLLSSLFTTTVTKFRKQKAAIAERRAKRRTQGVAEEEARQASPPTAPRIILRKEITGEDNKINEEESSTVKTRSKLFDAIIGGDHNNDTGNL